MGTMQKSLRVLIIEDSEFDARVMMSVLRQGGYEIASQRVESPTALRQALGSGDWDVILSDYNLPDFQAPEALKILHNSGVDLPFIIISGGIGEDVAVAAMKAHFYDLLDGYCSDWRKVVIENAGHWTQQEQPDVLNGVLVGWLQSLK